MKQKRDLIFVIMSVLLKLFTVSAQPVIGALTKTAKSGETNFLTGEGLAQASVMMRDQNQTLSARILRQDAQKALAVVPPGLGQGTLWVWVTGSGTSSARVPVNNPEPWWAQPDHVAPGGSTRIFGRNFDGAGGILQVVLTNNGATRVYNATVLSGSVLSLSLSNLDLSGQTLPVGTNSLYIKEPKNESLYGPVNLVVQQPWTPPTYSVNVTNYGASPNSASPANAAFIAAFNDVAQHGGGVVNVPPGTFILNEQYGYASASAVLPCAANRSGAYILQGAGSGQTTLEFKPTVGFSLYAFLRH